jgi:hypothetical protein
MGESSLEAGPKNTNLRGACEFDPVQQNARLLWSFYEGLPGFLRKACEEFTGDLPNPSRTPDPCCARSIQVLYGNFPGLFREFSQTFMEDPLGYCRDLAESWCPDWT